MKLKTIVTTVASTVVIGAVTKIVISNYEREIEKYRKEREKNDKIEIYCAVTEVITKLMNKEKKEQVKKKKAIITDLDSYRKYKNDKEVDMA